jgi:hypothetical protein
MEVLTMPEHTEPYQILPDLTPKAYARLQDSIRRFGVKRPIAVDEDGWTLDGHARKAISGEFRIVCPSTTIAGLTEAQKIEYILQVNSGRRQAREDHKRAIGKALYRRGFMAFTIARLLDVPPVIVLFWVGEEWAHLHRR